MNNAVLIIGESGTGKSTAIRTLPAEQTFIINILGKPLPFRGWRNKYAPVVNDTGNMFKSDDFARIRQCIKYVNTSRPDIKYLVIDDLGYTLQNDYLRKATTKGYEKFTEMGQSFGALTEDIHSLRDDLFCFVTMHISTDNQGKTKPKTVGKMVDDHVCIEGKFSYVLHSIIVDGEYRFITNNDGFHMAKMPMGMFPHYIPNDLMAVVDGIHEYNNEDIAL